MKNLFYLFTVSVFIFSCNSEKKQTHSSFEEKQVNKLLIEKHIFQVDSVYAALKKANKDQVTKSKQLFMQGLDFYVNKKNAAESVKLFRESVLYYPDSKTYIYLANAYIDSGDSTNADSALIASSAPPENYEAEYTLARIAALKKDTANAIGYLSEAFNGRFTNKKRLNNDKVFDFIRAERGFVSLLVTYLNDENKLKEILYKSFLATFSETKFPFELMRDSICFFGTTKSNNAYINYDFAPFITGMEDSRFSRNVGNEYLTVSKFKVNDKINAFIYKTIQVIVDTLPPVDIKITTYDTAGNTIDELLFAQHYLPEDLTTGKIDETKIITITQWKMKWKKNPTEEGYVDNEYLGEDKVGEKKFKISNDGHFVSYTENEKTDVVKK